jgi:hypothetical protein
LAYPGREKKITILEETGGEGLWFSDRHVDRWTDDDKYYLTAS